jgi:hypothetical protein
MRVVAVTNPTLPNACANTIAESGDPHERRTQLDYRCGVIKTGPRKG